MRTASSGVRNVLRAELESAFKAILQLRLIGGLYTK